MHSSKPHILGLIVDHLLTLASQFCFSTAIHRVEMGDGKHENESLARAKEDCRDGNRSWAMGRQDGSEGVSPKLVNKNVGMKNTAIFWRAH
jgi:hypothetical protein